jgi:LCP family protein required for cell wall assembly
LALGLTPVLAGVLIAGLVSAAWLALGSPRPAAGAVWLQVVRTGDAEYSGAPSQPFFFLVVGTDSTNDTTPGEGDSMHLIGVNPALGKGTVLNISYDTQGPDGGKINAYNSLQGLQGQAQAISQITGVPIQYAISANYPGFISMIDEIGGIDINVPKVLHDSNSGAYFQPGPQHVTGDQSLRFVRDRGDYVNADLTRTVNGGLFILEALATLQAKHPDTADTLGLIAVLARHIRLQGVDLTELWRLGRLALSINPANMRNVLLPVGSGPGTILIPTADAKSLLADFADDAVLDTH